MCNLFAECIVRSVKFSRQLVWRFFEAAIRSRSLTLLASKVEARGQCVMNLRRVKQMLIVNMKRMSTVSENQILIAIIKRMLIVSKTHMLIINDVDFLVMLAENISVMMIRVHDHQLR